jgi:hypothetical protein
MRALVFRVLAGLLAVAFGWASIIIDEDKLPIHRALGMGFFGIVFGVYAACGAAHAERLLVPWIGGFSGGGQSGSERPQDHTYGTLKSTERMTGQVR